MAIDFRKIGINLEINAETDFTNVRAIKDSLLVVNDSLISSVVGGKLMEMPEFSKDPILTVNGISLYTGQAISRGSYGSTIKVSTEPRPVDYQHNDTRQMYALKRQVARNDAEIISIVKEAIIGHALYKKTSTKAVPFETGPACLNVFAVFRGWTLNAAAVRCYYILMELGNKQLSKYLTAHPHQALPAFKRLAKWLDVLNTNDEYIHGDFKGNNIMVDSAGHLRIIDYGWNQMRVNGLLIKSKSNIHYNRWRDFTLLFHYIGCFVPSVIGDPSSRMFIESRLGNTTIDDLSPEVHGKPVVYLMRKFQHTGSSVYWSFIYKVLNQATANGSTVPSSVDVGLTALGVQPHKMIALAAPPDLYIASFEPVAPAPPLVGNGPAAAGAGAPVSALNPAAAEWVPAAPAPVVPAPAANAPANDPGPEQIEILERIDNLLEEPTFAEFTQHQKMVVKIAILFFAHFYGEEYDIIKMHLDTIKDIFESLPKDELNQWKLYTKQEASVELFKLIELWFETGLERNEYSGQLKDYIRSELQALRQRRLGLPANPNFQLLAGGKHRRRRTNKHRKLKRKTRRNK